VRGAEAVGYLTRDGEGTIAPVDCLVLTPEGVGPPSCRAGLTPSGARPRRGGTASRVAAPLHRCPNLP
jgi:hypothetical protein